MTSVKHFVDRAAKLLRPGHGAAAHRTEGPAGLDAAANAIVERVRPFTMTSVGRLAGLIDAVRYLSRNRIRGDIAECGVWRGGSMMAIALALLAEEDVERTLHLYDTFEGMSEPTDRDFDPAGRSARALLEGAAKDDEIWCCAALDDVRRNVASTGYPRERLAFVKGKVEDVLPGSAPGPLALLRLDTDWYESTRHELEHLYPLLVPNGVLIIDDYGHWAGSRRATDEFFARQAFKPLLNRLDYAGRLLIKPHGD